MFGTSKKAIDIYGLQIRNVNSKFILEAEVNKVDRKELLTLKNPKCTARKKCTNRSSVFSFEGRNHK